jgi:YVTN family beta-propeller protein
VHLINTATAGIDISPDGSRIFVANQESGNGTVSVIDAALDSVLRTLAVPGGYAFDVAAQSATRITAQTVAITVAASNPRMVVDAPATSPPAPGAVERWLMAYGS